MTQTTPTDFPGCPCGTGRPYDACCGPHLEGAKAPATAEELMRSRYTAYTRRHVDYIFATHDPAGIAELDRDATEQWAREASWQALDILSTERGQSEDTDGFVEFVARYELDGEAHEHHERSRFRKIDGAWFYVDGEMVKAQPVVRDRPKVGRNEPCCCGSGRKYKKCCGTGRGS